MLHNGSNRRQRRALTSLLFWVVMIPLCLSIGSFIFLNSSLIGYFEERNNEKIYLSTKCFLNGTISLNEPCKDDICWWPRSSGLCASTFRLCIKTIYVIIYENNQKTYTGIVPPWVEDDQTDTICYYDKTKSGRLRWKKPNTEQFLIEILFESLILAASIILWIVWCYLTKMAKSRALTNNYYHILPSEL